MTLYIHYENAIGRHAAHEGASSSCCRSIVHLIFPTPPMDDGMTLRMVTTRFCYVIRGSLLSSIGDLTAISTWLSKPPKENRTSSIVTNNIKTVRCKVMDCHSVPQNVYFPAVCLPCPKVIESLFKLYKIKMVWYCEEKIRIKESAKMNELTTFIC